MKKCLYSLKSCYKMYILNTGMNYYWILVGVVHVPKLATPVALPNNTVAIKAQQMKILVAPPPPTLNDKPGNNITAEVVDMEIEDQLEEAVIEQNMEGSKEDVSKPPPPIPNTSMPPPGYPVKKPEATPTPFTHQGPPPPFVTNSFIHPPTQVRAFILWIFSI
jgi:hypothetical protein